MVCICMMCSVCAVRCMSLRPSFLTWLLDPTLLCCYMYVQAGVKHYRCAYDSRRVSNNRQCRPVTSDRVHRACHIRGWSDLPILPPNEAWCICAKHVAHPPPIPDTKVLPIYDQTFASLRTLTIDRIVCLHLLAFDRIVGR